MFIKFTRFISALLVIAVLMTLMPVTAVAERVASLDYIRASELSDGELPGGEPPSAELPDDESSLDGMSSTQEDPEIPDSALSFGASDNPDEPDDTIPSENPPDNAEDGNSPFRLDRVIVKLADTDAVQSFSIYGLGLPELGVEFTESRLINPTKTADTADGIMMYSLTSDQSNIFVLTLAETGVEAVENAVATLNEHPLVEIAEPDYLFSLTRTPNDPRFVEQYALAVINAVGAWDITTGSKNVVVGIVDSGIDGQHPDLVDNLWYNPACPCMYENDIHGFNFTGTTSSGAKGPPTGGIPTDSYGHGTHVTGIVGATGNNGVGVTGTNWNVSLAWLGISDGGTNLSTSGAIEAINYARNHNIRILNASWGSRNYSQALRDTINNFGGLFVAAAGNDSQNNDNTPIYPASFNLPNVIAVAATDVADRLSTFSNFGPGSVHIAAPGTGIISTYRNSQYMYANGTSMASPHVAGVAALILSVNPTISTAQLREVLLNKARPVSGLNGIVATGGIVDAYAAVSAVSATAIAAAPPTLSFGSQPLGYTPTAAQTVTISNTGTRTITLNALPSIPNWTLVPGANWATPLASGQSRTFTISPNTGLAIGTYNPAITITGSIGANIQIQPTFTVTQLPATPSMEAFVTRLFQNVLQRSPDAAGQAYWINQLRNGVTGASVAYEFFFSNEFLARNISNDRFIDILYQALLDRPADASGRAYWMAQINVGIPREEILAGFVVSNEFTRLCNDFGIVRGAITVTPGGQSRVLFVTRLYRNVLGREPDQTGLNYWTRNLVSGTTGAAIAHQFFFSNEFLARSVSNDRFLEILYLTLLNRPITASDRSYWLPQLNIGVPRENVLAGFISSTEFTNLCAQFGIVRGTYTPPPGGPERAFVLRLYREVLLREPSQAELAYWVNQLLSGASGTQVAHGFVFSREMANRNLTNTQYVETLYRALIGRPSDANGMAYWISQLSAGVSREAVFNGFAASNEFGRICQMLGIRR